MVNVLFRVRQVIELYLCSDVLCCLENLVLSESLSGEKEGLENGCNNNNNMVVNTRRGKRIYEVLTVPS